MLYTQSSTVQCVLWCTRIYTNNLVAHHFADNRSIIDNDCRSAGQPTIRPAGRPVTSDKRSTVMLLRSLVLIAAKYWFHFIQNWIAGRATLHYVSMSVSVSFEEGQGRNIELLCNDWWALSTTHYKRYWIIIIIISVVAAAVATDSLGPEYQQQPLDWVASVWLAAIVCCIDSSSAAKVRQHQFNVKRGAQFSLCCCWLNSDRWWSYDGDDDDESTLDTKEPHTDCHSLHSDWLVVAAVM